MIETHPTITLAAALRDAIGGTEPGRVAALQRLATANDPLLHTQVVETVCRALGDRSPSVRQAAALAAGELRAVPALPQLISVARDDQSPLARQGAVVALGRFEDPGAREAIIAALADRSADVRFQAVGAAAETGLRRLLDHLAPLLTDPDAEVRGSAAAAFGDAGDPASADAIAALLSDPVEATRIEAAVALSRLRDHRGLAVLAQALSRRKYAALAAEQLFRLPNANAESQLLACAQRRFGDPVAAAWAAGALARLGHPEGHRLLTRARASRRPIPRGLAEQVSQELAEMNRLEQNPSRREA